MNEPFLEFMRPRQVLDIIAGSGIVFVPVSPCIEWHSYHMPLNTDGIIAEEVSVRLAKHFSAACTRCLPLGLDEFRAEKQKEDWGLDVGTEIFGMNFPTVPLESEYTTPDVFTEVVSSRVRSLKNSGFRSVFLVNHHGGHGQKPALQAVAESFSDDACQVQAFQTVAFGASSATIEAEYPDSLALKVGGHAGLSETHQLMAFRPDLIDLEEQPEGVLSVAETGILHGKPEIDAEFNPRNANPVYAQRWGDAVISNGIARIEEALQG